jgi:hypothetical protein
MRHKIAGLAAMIAVTVSAAPAMACYSPCAGGGLFGAAGVDSFSYGGYYGTAYAGTRYEQYPRYNGPQYYFVNRGPTYTGPGVLAPAPTYQERAVSGWTSYSRPYYYGYHGGPYANATSHYYDGARLQGPALYTYRWRRAHRHHHRMHQHHHPRTKYYYTSRPGTRYVQSQRGTYGKASRGHHHHHH